MRKTGVLAVLALLSPLPFGCDQPSSPTAPPVQAAGDSAAQKGIDDAAEILKGVNKSISASGPAPSGVNVSVTQVGPYRLKTATDVTASTEFHDAKAEISFAGRKLAIDFEKGQILIDSRKKAMLPSGTKEVEINYVGGKLSIKADGTVLISG